MSKPPAFQFYASDWLGSSQIALMSAEQERGYLRLLLHQWSSPGCCLPDDDEVLARLSLMGEGWFKNGSHLVRRCFVPNPDQPGTIRNEKLFQVFCKQIAWREKSAEGGRKSGESRKLQKSAERRVVEPPLEANGQPKGNTPVSSLQSPITPIAPVSLDEEKFSACLREPMIPDKVVPAVRAVLSHLAKEGKTPSDPGLRMLNWVKLHGSNEEVIESARIILANGYVMLKNYAQPKKGSKQESSLPRFAVPPMESANA
jgi:hypothetical protein